MSLLLTDYLPNSKQTLPPRRARVFSGSMRVDGLRSLLPVMLALWPAPRTYTGQDVAEIHLVGATPLVNLVLAHCLVRGARHAEPGEFTLRAFLSSRIDLTRAEAVLGVIEATSPAQLDAALEQLAGGLAGPILGLRDHLLDVVAHLEANLDFTEEPDVDPMVRSALAAELDQSSAELARLARRLGDRENPASHPRVVLVGPPNVGKSCLFNALLGRDQAIVSPQAGTTRDYLAALTDCDRLTVELVDTAGREVAGDPITAQAQALRALQTTRADLLLDCRSADMPEFGSDELAPERPKLVVWTKGDLSGPASLASETLDLVVTSAATGLGLDGLRSAIALALRNQSTEDNLPAGTGARCRGSLQRAESSLRRASECLLSGAGDELIAVDLRTAVDELGNVVGAVVTDDVLDRIFRRFCIGK